MFLACQGLSRANMIPANNNSVNLMFLVLILDLVNNLKLINPQSMYSALFSGNLLLISKGIFSVVLLVLKLSLAVSHN
jgi:hypothetical protein